MRQSTKSPSIKTRTFDVFPPCQKRPTPYTGKSCGGARNANTRPTVSHRRRPDQSAMGVGSFSDGLWARARHRATLNNLFRFQPYLHSLSPIFGRDAGFQGAGCGVPGAIFPMAIATVPHTPRRGFTPNPRY